METHGHTEAHSAGIPFMSPEIVLLVLTWVVFVAVLFILHKFAWKPILAGLDAREKDIRRAIEDADKTRLELSKIEETRERVLAEASQKAKDIVDQARKAAVEAANVIQQKNKKEAQILLENAQREINTAKEKAQAELKETSVKIALDLASKLLEENLTEEKNRTIINRIVKEIQ